MFTHFLFKYGLVLDNCFIIATRTTEDIATIENARFPKPANRPAIIAEYPNSEFNCKFPENIISTICTVRVVAQIQSTTIDVPYFFIAK